MLINPRKSINQVIFSIILIFLLSPSWAFAEPIPITHSDSMEKVIFDGKWTHTTEWKKSSLITFGENNQIHLRAAHQGDFVYVFMDAVFDTQIDRGSDRAVVCFDTENDKSEKAKTDDFCFTATLGKNTGNSIQGGSPISYNNHFKNIPNSKGFIGIGSVSDENDRYSKIPHASYEFRIPTEIIGRSDIYGFYAAVYDDHSKITISWPPISQNDTKIPDPSIWGEMVSPDKTIPEFELPLLITSLGFLSILILAKSRIIKNLIIS